MTNNTISAELVNYNTEKVFDLVKDKRLVIFDMDGTILSSEHLHYLATNEILNGETFSEESLYGVADIDLYELTRSSFDGTFEDFINAKNSSLIEKINQTSPEELMFKEFHHLFKKIKDNNQNLSLVTASEYIIAHHILEKCDIKKYFDLIITTKEVKNTKPHPEPYELALSKFQMKPKDAIIFEDSQTGIQAALSSGVKTIKVSWYEK